MKRRESGLFASCWELLRTPFPPERRGSTRVGWLILVLFGLQVLTGVLLSLYYEPSQRVAAVSVQLIVLDVDAGWLVRGVHYWTTTAVLALGLFHLLRMFVVGAYRRHGMTLWYIGLLLFGVGLALGFSGELLPWDEESYWLLAQALDTIERLPVFGSAIANAFRGGEEITSYTLRRAHAIHVLVLPGIAVVLFTLHLWLSARRAAAARAHDEEEGA